MSKRRTSIINKCDSLWQKIMAVKWKGRCARCGSIFRCSGHHVIKRRYMATRWAIKCGIYLCSSCHSWAEEHQREFELWLQSHHYNTYVWMELNKNPPIAGFLDHELKEIYKALKALLSHINPSG